MTSNDYQPKPEHKFTFGLWTVGNRGRDPFGDATRPSLSPIKMVKELSRLGAYGVNLHDNDLVPIDASSEARDRIVREFKQALDDHGMKVPMATTNLFYDPVFKDGAFTSNDPRVRLYAIQKTMRSMDLGAELGAHIYVFWGGREGAEVDAAKDPRFDQDLRFGSESIKNLFFLVKLLEESYDGLRHFDAHSYRSENEEGVWEFAAGCMRNYLILKEKARQFNEDAEIQALLAEIHRSPPEYSEQLSAYSRERAEKIKALPLDRTELAAKKLPYERLDQLTVDILFGVR